MEAKNMNAETNVQAIGKRILIADSSSLLRILPAEIWKLITKRKFKLTSNDLENLANSSPFFRNLLIGENIVFLFEKAFGLAATNVWKNKGIQEMPMSDVLKCRAVCSDWNSAIDKLICEKFQKLETNDQSEDDENPFISITSSNQFNNYYHWYNHLEHKTIEEFLNHFAITHSANALHRRNPFIWNEVLVNVNGRVGTYEDYQHYLGNISTMLFNYGAHIHDFKLSIYYASRFDLLETSVLIPKWLSNIPSLKKLFISFFPPGECEHTEEAIISEFQKYSWNNFEFLESLDVNCLSARLFNYLIPKCNQIYSLYLELSKGDYDFFTNSLPNLKTLVLLRCDDKMIEGLASANMKFNLKYLSLEYHQPKTLGYGNVLQMIQCKFANSLTTLKLQLSANDERERDLLWKDCKSCRLDLPMLKCIVLDPGWRKPVSWCLDFLLPLKNNLEKIEVVTASKTSQSIDLSNDSIIQFNGFENKMLSSNIWVLLKGLEEVHVKIDQPIGPLIARTYLKKEWMLNIANPNE